MAISHVYVEDFYKDSYEELMLNALKLAHKSPDPSTQNAALLYDPNLDEIIAQDVNRFPDHIQYTLRRWERPIKYSFIEHAERNVIYQAAKNGIVTSGTYMICPWAACTDCARAIVQAGITKVIRLSREILYTSERWNESVKIGDTILKEGGVDIIELPYSRHNIWLRRNGKLKEF